MNRFFSATVILILIILSFSSRAAAQAPPPWYPPVCPGTSDEQSVIAGDNSIEANTASLTGKVVIQDSNGHAQESKGISGASVKVSDGVSTKTTITGPGGYFTITGLKPGSGSITISAKGYHQATGSVNIDSQSTKNVLVSLRPMGGNSTRQYGYINVYAYGRDGHKGKWIGVTSIHVDEMGGSGKSWYNSWSGRYKTSYQSLTCSNAEVGKYYRIKVTWIDGTSQTSDVHLTEKYRDVSIYK